jgi:serine protease Do
MFNIAGLKLPRKFGMRRLALLLLFLVWTFPATAQTKLGSARGPSVTTGATPPATSAQVLREYDDAVEATAERVLPAVVQIEVSGFGPREKPNGQKEAAVMERQSALGSGVIVDPNGYIITNAHVVAGAQRVRVIVSPTLSELVFGKTKVLHQRREFDAQLLGSNQIVDLALLKIEETGLPYVALPEEYRVRLGQTVLAIGSPEGLEHTVTGGIVSAVGRQIDIDHPLLYIQTDAPINPGNSGGALVDRDGNLIGINTFILTETGSSEGLGFAIPEPTVRFAYQEFKKYGHIRQIAIGANPQTITPNLAAGLKLQQDWGVIISDVVPGGFAATAGLKSGDIVLAIDDHVIDSLPKYVAWLYMHDRNQPVRMSVLREAETLNLTIAVVEVPKGVEGLADLIDPQKSLLAPLGVFLLDLNQKNAGYLPDLRSSSGTIVVARASYAPRIDADLKIGDVIRSVNGISVSGVDSLRAELDRFNKGAPVVLEIEREGVYRFVAFEME